MPIIYTLGIFLTKSKKPQKAHTCPLKCEKAAQWGLMEKVIQKAQKVHKRSLAQKTRKMTAMAFNDGPHWSILSVFVS